MCLHLNTNTLQRYFSEANSKSIKGFGRHFGLEVHLCDKAQCNLNAVESVCAITHSRLVSCGHEEALLPPFVHALLLVTVSKGLLLISIWESHSVLTYN